MTGVNKYWFVEHVLWARGRDTSTPPVKEKQKIAKPSPSACREGGEFMQYIPPALHEFRKLAESSSLEFEGKVIQFFRMLGFRVNALGQGKGRNPDGIAHCREHNYAILFDAKSSEDGYRLGTDDRTMIEYVHAYERELRKEGYSNLYFVIVSSAFKGDAKASIDRIRKESSIKSVVLVTAQQCLRMLAKKIEDPNSFDFEAFQTLILDSGELPADKIDEFLEP